MSDPAGSGPRMRLLQQIAALVGYTLREARHKWTLVATFVLTTLFLVTLATVVSIDVVEGTIASARLFGTIPLEVGDVEIPVEDAVTVIQGVIAFVLATFGLLLALFVTGNILPRTLEPGWVELLVSQPVSRSAIILGRTLGAVAVVAVGLAYLVGGSWAILTWKTGFGNPGFIVAGLLILFTFLACYAGMVLIGVLTRSSPVSIIVGVGTWGTGLILFPLHRYDEWTTAFSPGWPRATADFLSEAGYWILPKTLELTRGIGDAARAEAFSLTPVWTSLPFSVACLALACWWFGRQDA